MFNLYDNRVLTDVSKATISASSGSSSKAEVAADETSATMVKFVNRAFFDQTKGSALLRKSCRPSTYSPELLDEFIILAASNACLSYIQMQLGASFADHTLSVSFNSGTFKTKVSIDRATIINLEVLTNARSAKGKGSLVHAIDNTVTTVGARLLRSNLLAPSTSPSTINARLDLLDEFLGDEVLFYNILELLGRLPDLDKTLAGLVLVPKGVNKQTITVHHTAKGIASLVCLKAVLRIVPAIANALDASAEEGERGGGQKAEESTGGDGSGDANLDGERGSGESKAGALAPTISLILRRPELDAVLRAVEEIFTESTTFSRNPHAMRHQECFALRPNAHGMIDLLRKAFLANVDDIFTLADEYSETYGFTVAVKETTARGYFLQIPAENEASLPALFIQPVKSKKHICCTTDEVLSLNMRTQENVSDLLLLTHERIQEVLNFARERYNPLASMCDAIALLDMVHSFCDCVASSRKVWCRPTISKMGTLAIKQGRFPIDGEHDRSRTPIDYVANDTFAGTKCNFSLITGVNGGGKSTYLKQIGLIVLLGHIGSYVPAEEAFIPIRDQICTRIGCGDDFEHNISSFMMEMRETAFILRSLTPRSLVLVDELGRATSNEDGVAIAWSVAERLLASNAFTFFVTHYSGLNKLADLYPNVSNVSFGKVDTFSDASGQGVTTLRILNDYSLVLGSCQVSSAYGIEMGSVCGWPEHVVSKARSAREYIVRKIGGDGGVLIDIGMAEDEEDARSRLADISAKLPFVVQESARGKSNLNETAAKDWLHDMWKDFVKEKDDDDGTKAPRGNSSNSRRRDDDDDDDDDYVQDESLKVSEREKKRIELMISLVKKTESADDMMYEE